MHGLTLVILLIGFVALIKGAAIFVDGSSELAKIFKVPTLIIGLTIVAFGTSAPELAVSTSAALMGSNEIALSNVLGSNIFNLLMVLGVCAIIRPIPLDQDFLARDYPVSTFSTLGLLLLCLPIACINIAISLLLLLTFGVYLYYLIKKAKASSSEEPATPRYPLWKSILFIIIGLALVIGGGQAVVYGAKEIARALGMTETLIGLTVVAVGTSLPELVTSIVAARKGDAGLAIGNVLGSNIFNLLFILGVSGLLHPITVNVMSIYDLVVLTGISCIAYSFSKTSKRITRAEGFIMVCIYVGYMVFAVVR